MQGKKYLTVKDIAEQLQLSPITIYKMLEHGRLSGGSKVGSQWRFDPTFVDTLINDRKMDSAQII